ncbi:MAG: exopolysaccharide biosynthesis polyprenyl glycosylphosphotransferase [Lachnospiraceae bacterium]|nr:exopolysaccharide biosynthesis polyprenyl glycosylphosphotransferase [Lachnospiraceae bacterium]
MKEICVKFEKSIMLVLKCFMYIVSFAVFFLLFSIDNREIIELSRTAAVTLSTYVIILFLLSNTYGSYDIGRRKDKDILFSLMLSGIITDLVTYFELTIMKTNEANNTTFRIENVGILISVILVQLLVYYFFVKIGSRFYFWINEAEKCLVITTEDEKIQGVVKALSDFSSKYRVYDIVNCYVEDIKERIVKADTVVLYEVPVEVRKEIIDWCYQNLKNIYYNPNVADILEHNSQQLVIDDIPFYAWQFHLITFEQRIIKRLMDLVISLILLIITSPILLVSAVCIKKNDGGKVFFRQKRATANGKVFDIYKFRTMKENVENKSVIKDDDRITKVGHILRKYRIDELPQLINIVKGDMSLVGPRPEMLENVEDYTRKLPEFRYRLRMKAGLTGYAQIFGKYNTSSKDKLILDLIYIENYSLIKDIQLLFQTVLVIFKAEESTEAFGDK